MKVKGKVQGVFFRAETRRKAVSLGLLGWVRNTPDGAVEITAQGEKDALMQFIDWCGKGPERAFVSGIETVWKDDLENFRDFSVY